VYVATKEQRHSSFRARRRSNERTKENGFSVVGGRQAESKKKNRSEEETEEVRSSFVRSFGGESLETCDD